MPDRQRHDEFIWALIFSLCINLLFVLALLAQRYDKNSSGVAPFVVSITASHSALPNISSANLNAIPFSPPINAEKPTKTLPTLQPQSINVDPLLPTKDNVEEETVNPTITVVTMGVESVLPGAAFVGKDSSTTTSTENSAGTSIFEDKLTGGHYTAAEYLSGEKPPYPKRAERNGWEGTVLLILAINANGEVETVGITKSSGYELLDDQARKSVGAWRFKPARRNGAAIATTVQQLIIFRPAPPETFR